MRNGAPLRYPLQLLGRVLGLLLVVLVVATAADLAASGASFRDFKASPEQIRALISTLSRAFNNLLAMVLAFIALAVPLTANMYTPKLVEIFLRDRVNLVVLLFFAVFGAHAIAVQAALFNQWTPYTHLALVAGAGIVGYTILIPYYYYVLGFLDPDRIIERVRDRVTSEFPDIVAGTRSGPGARARLQDRIHNLGNVILRAVDRADRDVALAAIRALQRVIDEYQQIKPSLDVAWFDVEHERFVGLSHKAVNLIRREHTRVEHTCLSQLGLAYRGALDKMPDAVSAISNANREVALLAARRDDTAVVNLCIRFFNTFLRTGMTRSDVHAIYDIFHQYRQLARGLMDTHPIASLAIARHFLYYARFAQFRGLPFVHELAAHEVAEIVQTAYERSAGVRAELLDVFFEFGDDEGSSRRESACAVLAGFFDARDMSAERDRLVDSLRRCPASAVRNARDRIAACTDPVFWEVTDRQSNLDYLEPESRGRVLGLLDGLLAQMA